jgi:hypothetical protein
MDLMQSFDAILFPADGRPPHVVSLMTSPASFSNPHAPAQTSAARIPHPEVHMEYIAEDPNLRAWHYQVWPRTAFLNSLLGTHKSLVVPHRCEAPIDAMHLLSPSRYHILAPSIHRHSLLHRGNIVTDGDLVFSPSF